jgi:hypothetical protein
VESVIIDLRRASIKSFMVFQNNGTFAIWHRIGGAANLSALSKHIKAGGGLYSNIIFITTQYCNNSLI